MESPQGNNNFIITNIEFNDFCLILFRNAKYFLVSLSIGDDVSFFCHRIKQMTLSHSCVTQQLKSWRQSRRHIVRVIRWADGDVWRESGQRSRRSIVHVMCWTNGGTEWIKDKQGCLGWWSHLVEHDVACCFTCRFITMFHISCSRPSSFDSTKALDGMQGCGARPLPLLPQEHVDSL